MEKKQMLGPPLGRAVPSAPYPCLRHWNRKCTMGRNVSSYLQRNCRQSAWDTWELINKVVCVSSNCWWKDDKSTHKNYEYNSEFVCFSCAQTLTSAKMTTEDVITCAKTPREITLVIVFPDMLPLMTMGKLAPVITILVHLLNICRRVTMCKRLYCDGYVKMC